MTGLPLVAGVLLALAADEPPPAQARTAVSPEGPVWVGQRVTLTVTVLAPGLFAEGPYFDLPTLPGVVVVPPQERPTVGTEQVGAVSYTTQAHDFAVFAQRAGTVRVPPITARFSAGGPGQPSGAYTVTTPPLEFAARTPPGADGLATVVSTPRLTVRETWRPDRTSLQVGDALTRSVTVEADDVFAMALPAFPAGPVAGLDAYPKPPEVTDRSDGRGSLTGRRVETTVYVCNASGTLTVPATTLTWWDLKEERLKRVRLPARTLEVEAAPPEEQAAPPTEEKHRAWPLAVAACAAAVLLLGWLLRGVLPYWRRHRAAVAASEPAYFKRFRRACRGGDATAVYAALLAWLDHFAPAGPAASPERFAARCHDPELTARIDDLLGRVYVRRQPDTPEREWSAAALRRATKRARRRLARATDRAARAGGLAPLNPVGRSEAPTAPPETDR